MRALFVFSKVSEAAAHATLHAGGAIAAARALRAHPESYPVADAAGALLHEYTRVCGTEGMAAVGAADGWRLLVASLRKHGAGADRAGLASIACCALDSAAAEPYHCDQAASAGAIPAIAAALRTHTGHACLQQYGLQALRKFAFHGALSSDLLAAARAPAAAAAALDLHCTDVRVLRAACGALAPMCDLRHGSKSAHRAASAAVAAGAPAALLAALRTHDSLRACAYAPGALAGLLYAETWPRDGAAWREARDTVLELIAAHGCPVDEDGDADPTALSIAACVSAATPACISRDAARAAPRAAVAALCVGLRTACDLYAITAGNGHVHVRNRAAEVLFMCATAFAHFARASGAHGASFSNDACAAGAIELLAAAAARAVLLDGGFDSPDLVVPVSSCGSALVAVAELAARTPATTMCCAAACGVHTLLDACRRTNAYARMPANQRDQTAALARRLRALVAAHEGGSGAGCAVRDCDLRLMSARRCCLPGCAAVVAADGRPLQRCAGCQRAVFCCAAHQQQAWPRHKAVCRARAAVDAARTRLLAHASQADAAARSDDSA